jgi:hypothetical protein
LIAFFTAWRLFVAHALWFFEVALVLVRFDHVHRKRESGRPDSSRQAGRIFLKLSAYETTTLRLLGSAAERFILVVT